MDTRTKILTPAVAERVSRQLHEDGAALKVVTGHFDPVLAAHAHRLRELAAPGKTLLVIITEPDQPLLAARSRAELVAALSVVDYVVLPSGMPTGELIERLSADAICHEEPADRQRTADLIRHVHERQTPPQSGGNV